MEKMTRSHELLTNICKMEPCFRRRADGSLNLTDSVEATKDSVGPDNIEGYGAVQDLAEFLVSLREHRLALTGKEFNRRCKPQKLLKQGIQAPDTPMAGPEKLPAALQKGPILYSGNLAEPHLFILPPSTAGQAKLKGRSQSQAISQAPTSHQGLPVIAPALPVLILRSVQRPTLIDTSAPGSAVPGTSKGIFFNLPLSSSMPPSVQTQTFSQAVPYSTQQYRKRTQKREEDTLLQQVPLSDGTVTRSVEALSGECLSNLLSDIKKAEAISLAIDSSCDRTDIEQLSVFVRFFDGNEVSLNTFEGIFPHLKTRIEQDRDQASGKNSDSEEDGPLNPPSSQSDPRLRDTLSLLELDFTEFKENSQNKLSDINNTNTYIQDIKYQLQQLK
ncbi:hypothetical protein E1301_Tti008714 [Triplophysa tibetana]|uniref:Uncharacterized protein n=1 Tax=Triplophysa tibetana TaxID=1572043 RepID=A0A5A9PPA6_9TELE|nr:hypothetical protein E1301_Tti008714 [Triplophysa tibetana]